ncbi:MAG: hypothetical protein ACTHJ0_09320 [Flavipsychrobacter sp.]
MRLTVPSLIIKLLFFQLLLLLTAPTTFAQQEQRYYRFQYHKYKWLAFHTKAFHVYFTTGSDSLASFVTREAPKAIEHVKKEMLSNDIKEPNIIIYPSTDQVYESNIGSYEPEQYTLPTFVYKGSRVLLAYKGSYDDLKCQLYEGLVRYEWETELGENSLEDQAKGTSSKDKVTMWFKEGAIRYFANGWPVVAEDKFRLSFDNNSFANWQQVLAYEPRLAGQAFCYFLSEHYQPKVIAQIFFQLRKKPLPRAIRLVTKHTMDTLYTHCFEYYRQRFADNKQQQTVGRQIKIKHPKGIVSNVLLNEHGDYLAYILATYNKRTVYITDLKSQETKRITSYQLPPWIDDHSADPYPLLQWHPDGKQLYVAMPKKGKITISRYTTDGIMQEAVKLYGVDGINSFVPLSDREYLLAGYRRGESDIVQYNENKERYSTWTDDSYDDNDPSFAQGGNLVFLSNRPKVAKQWVFKIGVGYDPDTLWQGIYTIHDKQPKAIAVDTVSYVKWNKLAPMADGRLLAAYTAHGTEQFVIVSANGKLEPLSKWQPFQYRKESDELTFYKADKDSIYVRSYPMQQWAAEHKASPADTSSPWLKDYRARAAKQAKEDSMLSASVDTTHSILEDALVPKNAKQQAARMKDSIARSLAYNPKNVRPYVLQLHSAYFSAKINNDYFINRYQPYLNYQGQFKFPEVGGMAQGGFTDLLENHHVSIAYRIPAGTEGSDFYIRYENTARRLDWGLSYFRKVESLQPDPSRQWVDDNGNPYPNTAKVKTHYYELFLSYPLSYDCALGFQTAVRKDRTIFLATDKYSLDFDPIESLWSINTFSFKLNKLQPTLPYLYKGFKAEGLVDLFKGFTQEESAVVGATLNLSYHQPLYRYITLVMQGHVGYSGGDKKVLYNLGGVDNNVTPRVDTTVHFSQNAPYAFQTLVTPFRGYYQNTLYGNEYAVINADVYFPIFQTLIPIETPLPSVNNLQLGLFTDLGTAGESWRNNSNNNKWKAAYGLSARTNLAGYPITVDVAWPGSFSKAVWYLSLKI